MITMEANHFAEKKDVAKGGFAELAGYGRSGSGMKVFPTTSDFAEDEEKPELTYSFLIPREGEYRVEMWTAPTNSLQNKRPLQVQLKTQNGESKTLEILSEAYRGGENSDGQWCAGVLNQIRVTETELHFADGVQKLTVGAMEAGLVLERILIYPVDRKLPSSYLGPAESFYKI